MLIQIELTPYEYALASLGAATMGLSLADAICAAAISEAPTPQTHG